MSNQTTQIERAPAGNGSALPFQVRVNGELLRTKGGIARRFKTEPAAQKALDKAQAAHSMKIRVRRCNGNKDCWGAVCGKHDFLMATDYSLDRLLQTITMRHPGQHIAVAA